MQRQCIGLRVEKGVARMCRLNHRPGTGRGIHVVGGRIFSRSHPETWVAGLARYSPSCECLLLLFVLLASSARG